MAGAAVALPPGEEEKLGEPYPGNAAAWRGRRWPAARRGNPRLRWLAYEAHPVPYVHWRLDISVDATGERNAESRIALGVSDLCAMDPSACAHVDQTDACNHE